VGYCSYVRVVGFVVVQKCPGCSWVFGCNVCGGKWQGGMCARFHCKGKLPTLTCIKGKHFPDHGKDIFVRQQGDKVPGG
jgi:hypothetical protein